MTTAVADLDPTATLPRDPELFMRTVCRQPAPAERTPDRQRDARANLHAFVVLGLAPDSVPGPVAEELRARPWHPSVRRYLTAQSRVRGVRLPAF